MAKRNRLLADLTSAEQQDFALHFFRAISLLQFREFVHQAIVQRKDEVSLLKNGSCGGERKSRLGDRRVGSDFGNDNSKT